MRVGTAARSANAAHVTRSRARTATGVVQQISEQLIKLPQPVPNRLRMNVQPPGHLLRVARVLQLGEQRLRQAVLLAGLQPPDRCELLGGERAHKLLVRQDRQRGQVVAGPNATPPCGSFACTRRKAQRGPRDC